MRTAIIITIAAFWLLLMFNTIAVLRISDNMRDSIRLQEQMRSELSNANALTAEEIRAIRSLAIMPSGSANDLIPIIPLPTSPYAPY